MAKSQGLTLRDLLDEQRKQAAAGNKQAAAQIARLEAIEKAVTAAPAAVQGAPVNAAAPDQIKQLTQQTEELKKVNAGIEQQTAALSEIKESQPDPKRVSESQDIDKQDRLLQIVQTVEAHKADKDDDRIAAATENTEKMVRAGLLDKSGDGLNSNVIKMSKDIRAMMGGPASANKPGAAVPVPPQVDKEQARISAASKDSASKYQRGFGDSIKDLKNVFTLKGAFDLDKASGPLGDMLKKKVAKDDYIADQRKMNPTASGDVKKDTERFGKQFEVVNKYRGRAKDAKAEIEDLKSRGATDEQIARTTAGKALSKADNAIAIADPLYRENRNVERAVPIKEPAPSKENAASLLAKSKRGLVGDPANNVDPSKAGRSTAPNKVTPNEVELALATPAIGTTTEDVAENARLMAEQTDLLKKIEENTRVGATGTAVPRKEAASTEKAQSEEGGGGILGDIADFALDKFGKKGGLGKAATAAKGFGGKALQFLSGKGGAIAGSALAVGAGAYTAYSGWQTASQNEEGEKKAIDQAVAAGQMTKEQGEAKKLESEQKASVGKGEAVGEGGGMAAGAIGGAALGASIGSIIPGAGTVVGGLVGGAIGGFAGSSVGKAVGGYAVKGYQGVKSLFGFGGEDKATPVAGAPVAALGGEATVESLQATRDKLAKAGPATDSAQSKIAHKNQLQQLDRAIAANDRSAQLAKNTAAGVATPASAIAPTPSSADQIATQSAENASISTQTSAPVIINAPSNSTNVSNQTSSYTAKSPTRNSESSVRKFIDSRYAF